VRVSGKEDHVEFVACDACQLKKIMLSLLLVIQWKKLEPLFVGAIS
jgi:hypothetical protein